MGFLLLRCLWLCGLLVPLTCCARHVRPPRLNDVQISSGSVWESLDYGKCHEQRRNGVKEAWCKT